MEGPLNILPRIEQGNRATVRATCWMLSLCEFLEQPSHAGRVERGVDFDGRMAGNGRSNAGAQRAKILILRGLIGGATGLPAAWKTKEGQMLSLSAMTMPHELARVVLAEQIYRAFTLLRGHPYPK